MDDLGISDNETSFEEQNLDAQLQFNWAKFYATLPYITLDPFWEIQILPAAGETIIRFRIKHTKKGNTVTVLLDGYSPKFDSSKVLIWKITDIGDAESKEVKIPFDDIQRLFLEIRSRVN